MKSLKEKMRAARQRQHVIGGYKLTVQRPTEREMTDIMFRDRLLNHHNCTQFVVGWDLKEIDLLSTGTDEPVAFDQELFDDWFADHSELWKELIDAVMEDYIEHKEKKKEAAGN